MKTKSIGAMIDQIESLVGTTDVTDWEENFIQSVVSKVGPRKDTTRLSDKQIEIIERLWGKHFAG